MAVRNLVRHVELSVLPLRSPTLPPATHTNCYILGGTRFHIVDPGAVATDELERLATVLRRMVDRGCTFDSVVLTHHHRDHVSGASFIRDKFGVPIAAHSSTAALLPDLSVDRLLCHGDLLHVEGTLLPTDVDESAESAATAIPSTSAPPTPLSLTAKDTWECIHTPGHASGHLILWSAAGRAIITGDMVASEGTIVLEPPDASLGDYLCSLQTMRQLRPAVLFPAHGDAIRGDAAVEHVEFYIAHRHKRTDSIVECLASNGSFATVESARAYRHALQPIPDPPADPRARSSLPTQRVEVQAGAMRPLDIVAVVYGETIPRAVYPLASVQVLCHLVYLSARGVAAPVRQHPESAVSSPTDPSESTSELDVPWVLLDERRSSSKTASSL